MKNKIITAVVLAAGQGKRMNSNISKQYMLLRNYPILYYSLRIFEDSLVDNIIVVVGEQEVQFVQDEIIAKYGFQKVSNIVVGGKERYHSVYNGLKAINQSDYVLIHDGARPFITTKLIANIIDEVKQSDACIVGVRVKDTFKLVDNKGIVISTPNREFFWSIQTPQAFAYSLILNAYEKLQEKEIIVTDDAMVVEQMTQHKVKIIEGSYNNIKITTPEDLKMGELLLE